MKQVAVRGKKQAGIAIGEKPQPKDNWVVVKVQVAPMCTEYKAFADGADHGFYGHEAAGEVVDVAQPGKVKVGDRVVAMPMSACGCCRLCLAGEYIHCENTLDFARDSWQRRRSDHDGAVSAEAGTGCCCPCRRTCPSNTRRWLAAGWVRHLARFSRWKSMPTTPRSSLAWVPLGLAASSARLIAARASSLWESNPYRAQLALDLGAEAVIDPTDPEALAQIRALTKDGRGVDKAVDCSGVVAAHRLCIDATRRKGTVAFVGECMDDTPLQISRDMIRKGLRLMGSWHFNMADSPRMLTMIGEVGAKLDRLITHRFAIDDIQTAWETQLSGQCGKVLLQPWEDGYA